MNSLPGKTAFVPQPLHDLGQHFTGVSGNVSRVVAHTIRETLVKIVRDVVDNLLGHHQQQPVAADEIEKPFDPWADDFDPDFDVESLAPSEPVPQTRVAAEGDPATSLALAIALTVAAWWLRRRFPLLGDCAVAILAGKLAASTAQLSSVNCPFLHDSRDMPALQRIPSLSH